MIPLELRKQLLIAESELNRAQLVADVAALSAAVRALADRARTFGSIASSAAVVVTGLSALGRGKRVDAAAKPSWLQSILKGAGLISTVWLAFRSPGRQHDGKQESSRMTLPTHTGSPTTGKG